MSAVSADNGIDKKTAAVARALPRKINTITAVSSRPIPPSRNIVSIAPFTNSD